MDLSIENLEVTHNETENRFEAWINSQLAKLDYVMDGSTIIMTHVGVHPDHRGRGVAGKVTQAALEYAKEKSLRVIPMCPYVGAYIRRNPQYMDITKPHAEE